MWDAAAEAAAGQSSPRQPRSPARFNRPAGADLAVSCAAAAVAAPAPAPLPPVDPAEEARRALEALVLREPGGSGPAIVELILERALSGSPASTSSGGGGGGGSPAARLLQDPHVCAAVASALGADRRWEALRRLHAALRRTAPTATASPPLPNAAVYCSLVAAYERSGRYAEALAAFREMADAGVQPSAFSYGTAAVACARGGMYREMNQLLSEMARGLI